MSNCSLIAASEINNNNDNTSNFKGEYLDNNIIKQIHVYNTLGPSLKCTVFPVIVWFLSYFKGVSARPVLLVLSLFWFCFSLP